jgi:hypothetical protein
MPHRPAPFPFQNREKAYASWNLYGPGVSVIVNEDDYADRMLDFWLRVQSKGGGRGWSMQPSVSWDQNEQFNITCLRVDFDTGGVRMFVFYLFPLINDIPMLVDGGEGLGLFVLELPLISAYCRTMAETIAAIDAVAAYIPTLILRRDENLTRGLLLWHYKRTRQLLVSNCLEPNDGVRLATVDRWLGRLKEEDDREQGGFINPCV